MPAVQDHARPGGDHLQSPGPDDGGKALPDRFVRDISQSVGSSHSQGRIRGLVFADQAELEVGVREAWAPNRHQVTVPAKRAGLKADLTTKAPHPYTGPMGTLLHDLERDAFAAGDHLVARFDDRRLLARNRFDPVAQVCLFVGFHGGYEGDPQIEGICGVYPAPNPDLTHKAVDT